MSNTYPRETVEFQPVVVKVDNVITTINVKFCITLFGDRPEAFIDPSVLDADIGVLVTGLAPGTYTVWAKILNVPEQPVIDCGKFDIT